MAQIFPSLDLVVEGRGHRPLQTLMHCHLCKILRLQSEPPSVQGHMHGRRKDRACGEKKHPSCPLASLDLLLDAEGQEQTLKRRLEVKESLTITLSVRPMHLPLLTGMHAVISLLAYFHETIDNA